VSGPLSVSNALRMSFVPISAGNHGVNPGMGWPLAVSAGMMEKSPRALLSALWALAAGHLLAMLLIILPFSLLVTLVYWQRQIRISASLLVIGFGVFRFLDRRHPRALARIRPAQLGLWSFAVAIAHGAGLMLVPIYLGLCRASGPDRGNEAGGLSAWLVYRYLGLKFVSRSWFNLDADCAITLILVGALSLVFCLVDLH
jgi:hypothetical protein